jgi:hypothetical protein
MLHRLILTVDRQNEILLFKDNKVLGSISLGKNNNVPQAKLGFNFGKDIVMLREALFKKWQMEPELINKEDSLYPYWLEYLNYLENKRAY